MNLELLGNNDQLYTSDEKARSLLIGESIDDLGGASVDSLRALNGTGTINSVTSKYKKVAYPKILPGGPVLPGPIDQKNIWRVWETKGKNRHISLLGLWHAAYFPKPSYFAGIATEGNVFDLAKRFHLAPAAGIFPQNAYNEIAASTEIATAMQGQASKSKFDVLQAKILTTLEAWMLNTAFQVLRASQVEHLSALESEYKSRIVSGIGKLRSLVIYQTQPISIAWRVPTQNIDSKIPRGGVAYTSINSRYPVGTYYASMDQKLKNTWLSLITYSEGVMIGPAFRLAARIAQARDPQAKMAETEFTKDPAQNPYLIPAGTNKKGEVLYQDISVNFSTAHAARTKTFARTDPAIPAQYYDAAPEIMAQMGGFAMSEDKKTNWLLWGALAAGAAFAAQQVL